MADNQFDALIRSLAFIGVKKYEDLAPLDRRRLTRLFLEIHTEIGEALYHDMAPVWEAFELGDDAQFGKLASTRMVAYVKDVIAEQLSKHADNMRQRRDMERRRFAGVDQD